MGSLRLAGKVSVQLLSSASDSVPALEVHRTRVCACVRARENENCVSVSACQCYTECVCACECACDSNHSETDENGGRRVREAPTIHLLVHFFQ